MCFAKTDLSAAHAGPTTRPASHEVAGVRRNVHEGLLDGLGGGAQPCDQVLVRDGFAIPLLSPNGSHETLRVVRDHPGRLVVPSAAGFPTTTPSTAQLLLQVCAEGGRSSKIEETAEVKNTSERSTAGLMGIGHAS